jgi:hypothetical protein
MNTTQSQSAGVATRPTALVALGVAAVSIALVSIVALGGFVGRGGNGANGGVVPPPAASPSAAAVTPAPSTRPSRTPSSAPSPTPVPSPAETDGGGDAMPTKVELQNATGADVYVDIVDDTGLLVDAASGTPGDGASVEGYTLAVESLGPTTLKLTWIDFPIDNALALYIDRYDGKLRLLLVQPEPKGATDAIGFDRELVLTFSEPISAGEVETFLQDGLDTSG